MLFSFNNEAMERENKDRVVIGSNAFTRKTHTVLLIHWKIN